MKTTKRIVLGLGTIGILTSGVFAKSMCEKDINKFEYKSKTDMHHKHMKDHKNPIVGAVMQLNLTQEQKELIKAILEDEKKSMTNPIMAFSDTRFDKLKFIKALEDKENTKIQNEANMVEKIYNLLTSTQKKDLKTIFDMKEIKRKQIGWCI